MLTECEKVKLFPPRDKRLTHTKIINARRLVYKYFSAEYKRLSRLMASSVPGDTLLLVPRRGWQLFDDQGSRQPRKNWSPSADGHKKQTYNMTVDIGYNELEDLPELIQRAQA